MNKRFSYIIIGILIISLTACGKQDNLDEKVQKIEYVINEKGEGWAIEECVIEISEGKAEILSGKIQINGNFEYIDIGIYQRVNEKNEPLMILDLSYSISEEARLEEDMGNYKNESEFISVEYPLKAIVTIDSGDEEEDKIIEIDKIEKK